MKAQNVFLLIALIGLPAFSAQAQPQGTQHGYSLQQCIDIGLKSNLDVNRAQYNTQRFSTYRTTAYGEFLPTVSASGSWVRSDENQIRIRPDGLVESRDSYGYSVEAGLTIFDGMRNFNTVDKSLLDFEASQQTSKRTAQTVVYTIQETFYNVLRLRQLRQVQEANVERSNKQLELIRELNKVGSVPLADVYKQEVQVGTDRLSLVEARNAYQNALVDIQALLGVEPRQDFTLVDGDAEGVITSADVRDYRSTLGDFNTLAAEAVRNRADYQEAELATRSAEKDVSISRSGHLPTLSAFAQYNWSNLELKDFTLYDRFSYGLSVSVPLFSGFQVSTAVERSEIAVREGEQMREQLRRTISTEIMKAMNNLETAEVNLDIAAKKLQSANEDHRIASERYNLGSGTLLDQLLASTNLRLAESDVVNSRFNYLTAQRRMEHQLGRTQN